MVNMPMASAVSFTGQLSPTWMIRFAQPVAAGKVAFQPISAQQFVEDLTLLWCSNRCNVTRQFVHPFNCFHLPISVGQIIEALPDQCA